MSPEMTIEPTKQYGEASLSQLDELEQSVVDVCDITDIQPPILRMLDVDIVLTRQDLVDALTRAEPTRRRLASIMLLETIRGKA